MSEQIKIPVNKVLKLNGKAYQLSAMTAQDYLDMAQYLRDQYMDEAKRQMHGLPLELAKHAWTEAKATADKIQPGTKECDAAANSPGGAAFMLWCSIKKKHPDFELDNCIQLMEQNYEQLSEEAAAAAGMEVNPFPPANQANQ